MPKVVCVEADGDLNKFSTTFRSLTEYLDFDSGAVFEKAVVDEDQAKSILSWVAKFHALFLTQDETDDLFVIKSSMLKRGGWWRKQLRPTIKWDNAADVFTKLTSTFPLEFSVLTGFEEELQNVRSKIRLIAEFARHDRFAQILGTMGSAGWGSTLIHGDVKSSNFFFARDSPGMAIGIDFQWVGGAPSGAADVAYFLFGCVALAAGAGEEASYDLAGCESFLSQAKKTESLLVRHYFEAFTANQKRSTSEMISRDEFDVMYDLELLEYFSAAVPYLLDGLDVKTMIKNRKKYGYLTYEMDARMLVYFFRRAIEAFDARMDVITSFQNI